MPRQKLLQAALDYAKKGTPVFACNKKKQPMTKHGYKDATTDIEAIKKMFSRPGVAAIGIPTGTVSNLVVLDIDKKNGVDGSRTRQELERSLGQLPPTRKQQTGSGGYHLLFNNPGGVKIPNSAGKLGDSFDVRGEGGYFIAPPSKNENGTYKWLNNLEPANLPQSWLNALVRPNKPPKSLPQAQKRLHSGQTTPYGQQALIAECNEVASAPDGCRNEQLFKSMCKIAELIEGGEVDKANAQKNLTWAAEQAGLQPREIQATINSALSRGANNPRSASPPKISIKTRPPLTIWHRDELLAQPDIPWIVKGILPAQGVGICYGKSTAGKTFLMLDFAAAIAGGFLWFGYVPKVKAVVYVCLEGSHGLKPRIQAWEQHNQCAYPEQVFFITEPIDLRKKQDVSALNEAIKSVAGSGAVVIIDTLNRAAPGLDENSSVDYGRILDSAAQIQKSIDGFVLFVGHTGKDETRGLRGHSSLFAGLDAVIKLDEVNKDESLFSWSVEKAKDGQDGKTFHFRRKVTHLGYDVDGDVITSCAIVQAHTSTITSKRSSIDLERLQEFKEAVNLFGVPNGSGELIGVDRNEWRPHFYKKSSCTTEDSKRSAFNKLINGLKKAGLIEEKIDGLLVFSAHEDRPKKGQKIAGSLPQKNKAPGFATEPTEPCPSHYTLYAQTQQKQRFKDAPNPPNP